MCSGRRADITLLLVIVYGHVKWIILIAVFENHDFTLEIWVNKSLKNNIILQFSTMVIMVLTTEKLYLYLMKKT